MDDIRTWTVRSRFKCGDIVYHKMATEAEKGMVVGLMLRETHVSYWVSWSDRTETHHFDCELTSEFIQDYEIHSETDVGGK